MELGSFYKRSVIKFVNAFVTYCLLVVYNSLTLTWTLTSFLAVKEGGKTL